MSEYQYYEFQTVDRLLTEEQIDELRGLSSRANITRTSFTNTYHWGDFRGDPRELMARYFDAFLYLANWGTRRLMLRLPIRLLDLDKAQTYFTTDLAAAWASGDHVILDLISEDENGDWQHDGEGWLDSIIPARSALARGDTRLLYLAWLLSVQAGELDEDTLEPPVPPNLAALPASLRSAVEFLRIDTDLLAVAAQASQTAVATKRPTGELDQWIEELPEREKDTLLRRFLDGDEPHLRTELLRRFHGEPAPARHGDTGPRTVGELLDAADAHREKREHEAALRAEREREREALAAAIAREQRLDALAENEEQAWQRVNELIDTKKQSEYDTAVALLVDLCAVAERNGQSDAFERRVQRLRLEHQRKPTLMTRFDKAGL